MKTLAVIGASYLQLPLVEKAKEMGLYVLCFAWRDGAVCADVADEFFEISIIEKEQILEICKRKNIDGICTIASDLAAPTVAYIAEHLGLVGNSYETAVKANNKYLMRNAFVRAGVLCPHYKRVISATELTSMEWCYPLIVKPTDRSGSAGVTKVERNEELVSAVETALSFSFCGEAIVEEYIEGREISVEFISYQGMHYPLAITDKVTTGAPHFVELEHHQPSTLSPSTYETIYDITRKALNSLGITNGASHSEYKITTDGKVVIMEIGARMGGDFIGSDLVRLSIGYDFVKGVIDVALGQFEPPIITSHNHSGVFFLCKESEHLLPYFQHPKKNEEIVQCKIFDNILQSATKSADRSGYLIYVSNTKINL